MNSKPKLISENGLFRLVDSDTNSLKQGKVERVLKRYNSYFVDFDELILVPELNYIELSELIEKINSKLEIPIEVDSEVQSFIEQNRYAINEQKIAGITIKEYDTRWNEELKKFQNVLDIEITRPLKPQQVQASFYLAMMKRAANFSVPGAGKTAMMYGTYAYLSSSEIDEVDKILVVSPLNAFNAWSSEFTEVFGSKRKLKYMCMKDYTDAGKVRIDWGVANVITINYESLFGWKLSVLNELIDQKTMIVFDEVHRIKNPEGMRAKNALNLGKIARYHYVLTGTPIPNTYKDIYNFLHLLYDDEYSTFFGWNINELENPNSEEVNEKLQPFFWRTNKEDLKVPPVDRDKLILAKPSAKQQEIAETIYEVEEGALAKYVRLLQASSNPALLTEKIDIESLGLVEEDIDFNLESAMNFAEQSLVKKKAYIDLGVENLITPKFQKGIELISQLVSENKKVLVWGMFVGTMQKIVDELRKQGIAADMVYGGTPQDDRTQIIDEFRSGSIQVLVSNPATLGESISLHQTVHDAVYFEFNFNLTFMLQSRDRIHRLGLKDGQYTRYYYLMTEGDSAHAGFIDQRVYDRLKEKEEVMMNAIDGQFLAPEVSDDYLDDVKRILE